MYGITFIESIVCMKNFNILMHKEKLCENALNSNISAEKKLKIHEIYKDIMHRIDLAYIPEYSPLSEDIKNLESIIGGKE